MCGIAGLIGQFDQALLPKMAEKIQHRGPDGQGLIRLANRNQLVEFAHRRLAIIDLRQEGKQPMTVECPCCNVSANTPTEQRLWLSYNGEIYNYKELRHKLIQKGHVFTSETDSEVILHLYAEEGLEFLTQLNGIFALALYDGRLQQSIMSPGAVLLARDGIGVKPLYYAETKTGILFSSELKALLAFSGLDKALDLTALHHYLAYLWCPAPLTPFESVKKMLPGQALIISDEHIVKNWLFYDLPYHQALSTESAEELAKQVAQSIETAVKRQLVADVPVGAFLSGGLDSSAVVAMMRRHMPNEKIKCYTIGFADENLLEGNPNDLPFAKKVAAEFNLDLHTLYLKSNMIDHLEKMLYHLDEPQADPAPINAYLIAEQARQDGIKVLLSGAGGDDIFSGYRRHYALHLEKYWRWLPTNVRASVKKSVETISPNTTFKMRLRKATQYMDLNQEKRLASYFLWSQDALRLTCYSDRMFAHNEAASTLDPLLTSMHRVPSNRQPLDKMLYLETKHFLADHNLNYTDKVSMAHGVEVRVPLLDLDVVELAARIPSHLKQAGKVGKAIFKQAMQHYLPQDVIYRKKTGFGAPLKHWLNGELKPYVMDMLCADQLKKHDLFDAKAIQQLMLATQKGQIDGTYTIFSILCIETWCRLFLE